MRVVWTVCFTRLFTLFQNGFVECVKDLCPDEQGCYMLQDVFTDTKGCCRRCKGKFGFPLGPDVVKHVRTVLLRRRACVFRLKFINRRVGLVGQTPVVLLSNPKKNPLD